MYNLLSKGALCKSPTSGVYLKWHVGNKIIRTSTFQEAGLSPHYMYESYGEVIASRLAKWLGFNSVDYKLCEINIDNKYKVVGCEYTNFVQSGKSEYINIWTQLTGNKQPPNELQLDSYSQILSGLQQLDANSDNHEFRRYLYSIILLDYIVVNYSRTLDKIGFIRDVSGNLKPAPIFDTGYGMFCSEYIDSTEYSELLASKVQAKPFPFSQTSGFQFGIIDMQIYNPNPNLKTYISRLLKQLEQQGLPVERSKFIKSLLYARLQRIA